MSKTVFSSIDSAERWLSTEAKELAGNGRIIVVQTINGLSVSANVVTVDVNRGMISIECEDGTKEEIEVGDLRSVTVTDRYRMTPERAYREMIQMESTIRTT
jgi:ferric-dicitrate binding protein FerR (iron transport regulator)